VQCSAEFGDDATLDTLAAQLDQFASVSGLGLLLFRAGAAPWHDELAVLRRLSERLRTAAVRVAESLDIWDICALIAHSRGYCGSSLHGRIVAMAYALPRLNLRSPVTHEPGKHEAYAATWDDVPGPACVTVSELADGMRRALATDAALRQRTAQRLTAQYRQGFAHWCATGRT